MAVPQLTSLPPPILSAPGCATHSGQGADSAASNTTGEGAERRVHHPDEHVQVRLRHFRLDRLGAGGRRGALPVQTVRALQPMVFRCVWVASSFVYSITACAACRACLRGSGTYALWRSAREFSLASPPGRILALSSYLIFLEVITRVSERFRPDTEAARRDLGARGCRPGEVATRGLVSGRKLRNAGVYKKIR